MAVLALQFAFLPVLVSLAKADTALIFNAWTRLSIPNVALSSVELNSTTIQNLDKTDRMHSHIVFQLYTRQNPSSSLPLDPDNMALLQNSTFSPKKSTKVLIHGWNSSEKPQSGVSLLKEALLRATDVNVVTVDWSRLNSPNYLENVGMVPAIGTRVASFVAQLDAAGAKMDDIHIIGHSLGAQIAGAVGSVAGLAERGIGRITGLDPAMPGFDDPNHRLDPSDAAFVDVVHTDGGILGFLQPIGHVDLYPNGGVRPQPQCTVDISGLCSHCYSFELFRVAIEAPNDVSATECASWAEFSNRGCADSRQIVMGLNTDQSARGTFFLDSSNIRPLETLPGFVVAAKVILKPLLVNPSSTSQAIHC